MSSERTRSAKLTRGLGAVGVATLISTGLLIAPGAAEAATPRLAISKVLTTTGPLRGGNRITIIGSGFHSGMKVLFGRVYGTKVHVLSRTRVAVTAPAHAPGTYDVRVVVGRITSAVRTTDRYRFIGAPLITSMDHHLGNTAGGEEVTVVGPNFVSLTGARFGATPTTFVQLNPVTIRVAVPAHIDGSASLTLTSKYGVSALVPAASFRYGSSPVVQGLSVTSGPTGGGTVARIYGRNFSELTGVYVGSPRAGNVQLAPDGSYLEVTTPAHDVGQAAISISNVFGTSAPNAAVFTYVVGSISNLHVSALTSRAVSLAWTLPPSPGRQTVQIRRTLGTVAAANPTEGTLVSDNTWVGTFVDKLLIPSTTYSYAVFVHDSAGNFGPPVVLSATTATESTSFIMPANRSAAIGLGGLTVSAYEGSLEPGAFLQITTAGLTRSTVGQVPSLGSAGPLRVSSDQADLGYYIRLDIPVNPALLSSASSAPLLLEQLTPGGPWTQVYATYNRSTGVMSTMVDHLATYDWVDQARYQAVVGP